MKKRTVKKKIKGCPSLPYLGDESGMLLVMVMVILLVVSTMTASSLINAFLEKSLAKNQNYASRALQAADGGLAAGMTWIRENKNSLPSASPWLDAGGNPWEVTLARDLGSGGSYDVTMRFLTEWYDYNGDGTCDDPTDPDDDNEFSGYDDQDTKTCPGEFVLFNECDPPTDNCWGFDDSFYLNAGEGYPVIEVNSVGRYGEGSYREISLFVARNKIDMQVEGAITARGDITFGGNGYADGHNFDYTGAGSSASCAAKPAVTVDPGVSEPTCAGADGESPTKSNPKGLYGGDTGPPVVSCTATHDPSAPGKRDLETTPWGIMGISEDNFNSIFTQTGAGDVFSGNETTPTYVWRTGDMHVSNGPDGFGILVVHNEHYDPDVHEISDPASPLYNNKLPPDPLANPLYNPLADSSAGNDPTYMPAEFKINGNVKHTGVIIADKVIKGNGTADIVGALISLGGVNVLGDFTGSLTVKYSCDAVEKALAGFGYGTRLGWHRIR